jgi:hypothetical protein
MTMCRRQLADLLKEATGRPGPLLDCERAGSPTETPFIKALKTIQDQLDESEPRLCETIGRHVSCQSLRQL